MIGVVMRTKSNGTVYPSIMGVFIAAIVCVTVSIYRRNLYLLTLARPVRLYSPAIRGIQPAMNNLLRLRLNRTVFLVRP